MKMFTLRLKPKTIFGLILILAGIIVISITFFSNHAALSRPAASEVTLETDAQREDYLTSLGWEFKTPCEEKEVQIPQKRRALIWKITKGRPQPFIHITSQITPGMRTETAYTPICSSAAAC